MKFYLGTHRPAWLERADFPLFISHRQLMLKKNFNPATCNWALDSGGFTELSMHGEWQTSADEYIAAARRYMAELGRMDWASIQDWMCEPWILSKTGLTIKEHQWNTVHSYLDLMGEAPDVPWTPVIQGWTLNDYFDCILMYDQCGVDLKSLPVVGIGSVCRRQHTSQIDMIMMHVSQLGLKLHGFGVKTQGLWQYSNFLYSADSMAWSYAARMEEQLPECVGKHRGSCQNCMTYAAKWRAEILRVIDNAPPPTYDLFASAGVSIVAGQD